MMIWWWIERGGGSDGAQQNFQELVGTNRVHEPIVATKGDVAADQTYRPNKHHNQWTAENLVVW